MTRPQVILPIIVRIVRNLRVSSPNHLAARRDQAQLADVDFDDSSLGQNAEVGVQRVLRVLLDSDNRQLNCDSQLLVCNMSFLNTKTLRADKPGRPCK